MPKFYLVFVGVSPNSGIISSIRFPTAGKLLVKLIAGKIISLWFIHTATERELKQDRERERWVPIFCAELYILHRNRETVHSWGHRSRLHRKQSGKTMFDWQKTEVR